MGLRRVLAIAAVAALLFATLPWLGSGAQQTTPQLGDFLVMLREQADLSGMAGIPDLTQRRWTLFYKLREVADRTQGGLRDFLQREQTLGRVVKVTPLWIINAIAFRGQVAVADAVRTRSEVEGVSVDEVVRVQEQGGAASKLWNILKTRVGGAGGVWDQGFSGSGLTVANIDTGVDFAHPALEPKFRGPPIPQRFHHNWIDTVEASQFPIDLNGHGTHTMGIMVGGDGLGPDQNDTGLAYGAKWIAARAFNNEGKGLTGNVLLASQWILAPTDLNFQNPRPDLAPDVVNNSWGVEGGSCRIWFRLVIQRWRLANIFPAFSIGDGSAHSPGDLGRANISSLEPSGALGTGATDELDARAGFSAQGPSSCLDAVETVKPDVHAPGVGIWSTTVTNSGGGFTRTYAFKSGTSMASAHVAGTAALMLEAAGGRGSLSSALYEIDSAIKNTAEPASGCAAGVPCRRLNALAAVQAVRRDGILRGTVGHLDAAGIRRPLANAKVSAIPSSGGIARTTLTDAAGTYTIRRLAGAYSVEVRGPVTVSPAGEVTGWIRQVTATVVSDKDTVTRDFTLQRAPNRVVEGDVLAWASGDPATGVLARLADTPLEVPTDPAGHFRFAAVPDPSIPDPAPSDPTTDYDLSVDGDRCTEPKIQSIVVRDVGPNSHQIVRSLRRDVFGYWCLEKEIDWTAGTTILPLQGDDLAASVALPFDFPFYGVNRNTVHVSTNGFVSFDRATAEFQNSSLPTEASPNAAAYPFWDDLSMDSQSKILTAATLDKFVIEWRKMTFAPTFTTRITFALTLHANGDLEFQYKDADPATAASGVGATIGLEDDAGKTAFQYSNNESVVFTGKSLLFSPTLQPGEVRGTVTGQGGEAIGFAQVSAVNSAAISRTVTADSGGRYRIPLNAGTYTLKASAFHYDPATLTNVTVTNGNLPNCFPSSKCPVNLILTRQPGYTVSGTVTDVATSAPLAGIPVSLGNPNISDVRTNAAGTFQFLDIPAGTYRLSIVGTGLCRLLAGKEITVSGPTTAGLQTSVRRDEFGYMCQDDDPIDTTHETRLPQPVALAGDDTFARVDLPFAFPLYGMGSARAFVSTNGFVRFDTGSAQFDNGPIPSAADPNFALYPFWDDLLADASSKVQTRTDGTTFFSIEWLDFVPLSSPATRISFEVILHPSGSFEFQYRNADPDTTASGSGATIGLEDRTGARAFSHSVNQPSVASGPRIAFSVETRGITGVVREAGTGASLAGVRVTVCGGCVTGTTTTDAGGGYGFQLPEGTYSITASQFGYQSVTKSAVVPAVGLAIVDFDLPRAPLFTVSGTVTEQRGSPAAGIEIRILDLASGASGSIYANQGGFYSTPLPGGTYQFSLPGRCPQQANSFQLVVDRNITRDISVQLRIDSFGNVCVDRAAAWVEGLVPVTLLGDAGDSTSVPVPLPFDFPIYGRTARVAHVSTDGFVQFERGLTAANGPILSVFATPQLALDGMEIFLGAPDADTFVIEWRAVLLKESSARLTFEVVLKRNGEFVFQYKVVPENASLLAKVGIEDGCPGGASLVYSDKVAGALRPGLAIGFLAPAQPSPGYVPCG